MIEGGHDMELTPSQIVEELDKYIVGQKEAKRAVSIALRNRYRRSLLEPEMRDEVIPKNIIMIGPTGVGKTEIARRLAKIANAPFIKVEATKFIEVGYVGRDVESIIRDLVEYAIRMIKNEKMAEVEDKAITAANERIVSLLAPSNSRQRSGNPLSMMLGMNETESDDHEHEKTETVKNRREQIRMALAAGQLEDHLVEIEVEENTHMLDAFSGTGIEELGVNFQDMFGGFLPRKRKFKKLIVSEARKILTQEEANKLIDMDSISSQAIERCEQSGIVFLDEIDKIAGKGNHSSADVSREGVQRDILPIVEGSTVMTKHGPIRTDYILFIAAGAFHVSKPSDLIPELQGRFPIRVELSSLTKDDFKRILTEPKNALIKQYQALMKTENIDIEFTESGIDAIAEIAEEVNESTENIGARRMHTVMERLLESLSFEADRITGNVNIDDTYVRRELNSIVADKDLSRYIL